MLTFSTENTLSLEPKSPTGSFACSTIYFLLTSPLLRMNASTKQHLLCKTKPISGGLLTTVTSAITSTYEHKPPLEAPKNKANSHKGQKPVQTNLIRHPRISQRRFTKNEPASTKQHLLCKTKPISGGLLTTVTSAITSTYDKKPPLEAPKNKANSNPISNATVSPPRRGRCQYLDFAL